MKKILTVALLVVTFLIVGCGDAKKAEKDGTEKDELAVILKDSFWVADSQNMIYLYDALIRQDREYLNQLILEGKVFYVDRDTIVSRFGVAADPDNVLILFREGRYTNKAGCTFKENLYSEQEYKDYLDEKKKESEIEKQKRKEKAEQQEQSLKRELHSWEEEKKAKKREAFTDVEDFLDDTESYTQCISSGNINEVARLEKLCADYDLKLSKYLGGSHQDKTVFYGVSKAQQILKERKNALEFYLHVAKYGENETYTKPMITHIQKAETLRQEFLDEYGF